MRYLHPCCAIWEYPDSYKLEIVTPVPKCFPPQVTTDLRNIAGTPNFSRIFEKFLTEIMGHILNSCPQMLDRYEWRHNGVLAYLYDIMMNSKPPGITIYADIEGAKVNGGTVPPDIMITSQRPDMVIINKNSTPSTVYLVELTCPFTRNIAAANTRKRARYEFLASDIKDQDWG